MSLAVSPDGQLVAAGTSDGCVKVWSAALKSSTAQLFSSHCAAVASLAWAAKGDVLLSVDASAALHVWGAQRARGKLLAVEDMTPPPIAPPAAPTAATVAATAASPAAPARTAERRDERLSEAQRAAFVSDDDSPSDDGSPFVDAAAQAAYDDIMTPGKLVRSHSASSSPRDPESGVCGATARGSGGVSEAKEAPGAPASPVSVEVIDVPSSGGRDGGATLGSAAFGADVDADIGNRVLRMEEELARRLHHREAYGQGDLQTSDGDIHADVPPMPYSLTSSGLLGYDGGATCFGSAAHPMQGGAWARNLVWHPERAMLAYCSAGVR